METPSSLGSPAPGTSGDVAGTPRAPGSSDGRSLAQQYYDPNDPLSEFDLVPLLEASGVAPADLDAAIQSIVRNEPAPGAPHPYFGLGDRRALDTVSDPVIIFSGQYSLTVADIDINSRGLALRLVRAYRSGPSYFGPLGFNWDHSYNVYLRELSSGGVALWTGELREDVYKPKADGTFESPVGGREQLVFEPAAGLNPDRYLLTDRDSHSQIACHW
jgi:hypothetical protein